LGLNVFFIAVCGALALVRQGRMLLYKREVTSRRSLMLIFAWMLLSLLVGGQWAWTLRPFFGLHTVSAAQTPFCLGGLSDFRGATNFYEAVYHLISPPQLPTDWYLHGWGR